jgi:hypothetical protein
MHELVESSDDIGGLNLSLYLKVYTGGGEYNIPCALACCDIRANQIAYLKGTVKRSFRLELLLTNQFYGILDVETL